MIDIDEGLWPKPFLQLFACDYFAGALQQDGENLKRLAAEFKFLPGLSQFSRLKVDFEASELD